MKKIIFTLILCMCCLFSFTACDNLGKEHWLDMQKVAEEVFASEEFKNVYGSNFGGNLDVVMEVNESYAEIKNVLAPLFVSAVSYAYNQYNDFLITPLNNNSKFKNEMKKVNKNLTKFKDALKDFNEQKTTYLSYITFTDVDTSNKDIELGRLLLFKRDYLTIIESAYNLSESIINARRAGYYDFSNYDGEQLDELEISANCNLAVGTTNLEIVSCAIKIARAYNAKEVASQYANYWTVAQDFYNNVVAKSKSQELVPAENAQAALLNWKTVYNMFKDEKQELESVLKKINLKLLVECNNDSISYANATNNSMDENYVTFFVNFYQNVTILKDYTLKIFNQA